LPIFEMRVTAAVLVYLILYSSFLNIVSFFRRLHCCSFKTLKLEFDSNSCTFSQVQQNNANMNAAKRINTELVKLFDHFSSEDKIKDYVDMYFAKFSFVHGATIVHRCAKQNIKLRNFLSLNQIELLFKENMCEMSISIVLYSLNHYAKQDPNLTTILQKILIYQLQQRKFAFNAIQIKNMIYGMEYFDWSSTLSLQLLQQIQQQAIDFATRTNSYLLPSSSSSSTAASENKYPKILEGYSLFQLTAQGLSNAFMGLRFLSNEHPIKNYFYRSLLYSIPLTTTPITAHAVSDIFVALAPSSSSSATSPSSSSDTINNDNPTTATIVNLSISNTTSNSQPPIDALEVLQFLLFRHFQQNQLSDQTILINDTDLLSYYNKYYSQWPVYQQQQSVVSNLTALSLSKIMWNIQSFSGFHSTTKHFLQLINEQLSTTILDIDNFREEDEERKMKKSSEWISSSSSSSSNSSWNYKYKILPKIMFTNFYQISQILSGLRHLSSDINEVRWFLQYLYTLMTPDGALRVTTTGRLWISKSSKSWWKSNPTTSNNNSHNQQKDTNAMMVNEKSLSRAFYGLRFMSDQYSEVRRIVQVLHAVLLLTEGKQHQKSFLASKQQQQQSLSLSSSSAVTKATKERSQHLYYYWQMESIANTLYGKLVFTNL
jgi:hypothetical protein